MVNSDVSGIAFSVHPVTEDRNQIIIEAGYGLGEAIVSGQVTPDNYVFEKSDEVILEINVADQEKMLVKKIKGGNKWIKVTKSKIDEQKLTGRQIVKLAQLIMKIEKHYGFPCDIEWALEGSKLYITQSRPITTLKKCQPSH